MGMRSALLIAGPRNPPPLREPLREELHRLGERHGQMIAAIDEQTGEVTGTLGLYPDRDEGGTYFHLTGIQLERAEGGEEVDVFLMEKARDWLRGRRASRLKFGTSPLLTRSAWLYVNRFGCRYRWHEGTRTPEGRPWPYVSCECDFDDPLARPLDLRDEDVLLRSLLTWEGGRPRRRAGLPFSGPLAVTLPDLDSGALARAAAEELGLIDTLHRTFQALHVHGYEFAWFDGLPAADPLPGQARWYYVMKRIVSL